MLEPESNLEYELTNEERRKVVNTLTGMSVQLKVAFWIMAGIVMLLFSSAFVAFIYYG